MASRVNVQPLSRQEIRAVDRRLIDEWGVPGVVLMENAGRNAADAIGSFLGGLEGKRVAVVAGVGNNGGDGFVIARHVVIRGGSAVVFLVADPEKISGDAAVHFAILPHVGVAVRPCRGEELLHLAAALRDFDVVVDALGGTGISGALRGDLAEAVRQINVAGRRVVAVDIPTGLDCDLGTAAGSAVEAALTVTMHARKKGFDAADADRYTGRVIVVDIGVPPPAP